MLRSLSYTLLLLCALFFTGTAFGQSPIYDNIIQINGVTMTADSLRGVPEVTVMVKNKNRGVTSSPQGVFSIVIFKGDTLQFSAVGFRPKEYVVPKNLPGHYYSMVQLMVQDTFYLPETIIRPMMTPEQFDFAFKNTHVPDDAYEIARRNTDAQTLRIMAYSLPRDGKENQAAYQNLQAQAAQYYSPVQRPQNIFNPLAWAEFYDAWKRGDFRKKTY